MHFSIDDTVTLTVDGRKILTYNEISPFAINHFGFCVSRKGDEARFFYNCKAYRSNDVSSFNQLAFASIQIIYIWNWYHSTHIQINRPDEGIDQKEPGTNHRKSAVKRTTANNFKFDRRYSASMMRTFNTFFDVVLFLIAFIPRQWLPANYPQKWLNSFRKAQIWWPSFSRYEATQLSCHSS